VVATSLLDINVDAILGKVERLAHVKLPRSVIEVSLEPSLRMLCIRFKKPVKTELGEPIRHGIHLFTDGETKEITAIEIIDLEN
jgi:hypothetical protein